MEDMYDRNKTVWESQDGRQILVKDLTTPHLVNILNWMQQRPQTYSLNLYRFMEEEARFRAISEFTKNNPIPFKQDDGTWAVRNISVFGRLKSLFFKHKAQIIYKIITAKKRLKYLIAKSFLTAIYNRLERKLLFFKKK